MDVRWSHFRATKVNDQPGKFVSGFLYFPDISWVWHVSFWLRLLKKSDLARVLMSAFGCIADMSTEMVLCVVPINNNFT